MSLLRNILGYRLALSTELAKASASRRQRLTNIIRHANNHCPYYKDKYTGFLEGEKDFTDEEFNYAFSHLPIINRGQLDNHNKAFCSNELENKPEILEDKQPPSAWTFIKHLLFKQNYTASISISGTTTRRWLDHHDIKLYTNSILHALKKNGWKRGQSLVALMPENSYFTQRLVPFNNILFHLFGLTIQPFEVINKDNVTQLLATLKNTNATTLITLPHTLLRVAQTMQQENVIPYEGLQYINLSGSFFLDCNKATIQTMFPNSDIQCSYGTTQCGMIAHQSSLKSSDYNVFDDYVYLEQGSNNSILVTTYHQKAFPLIRYKIEDMGRVINASNGKQRIESLEGCYANHLIGSDGYMYFPSFFNIFINELNKALRDPIVDFSLSHNDRCINGNKPYLHLKFVLNDQSKKEKVRKAVLETLKPVFANYRHIAVSFPEHIPHNSSTKYKIIHREGFPVRRLSGYEKFEKRQPNPACEQNIDNEGIISIDKHAVKQAS